jgi:carboxymethylenebutenolidase
MPQIDSLMKALHKDYVGINYEGAIHGFLRAQDDPIAPSARGPMDPAAAAAQQEANLKATRDGWPRTIAFLKKNLGVK